MQMLPVLLISKQISERLKIPQLTTKQNIKYIQEKNQHYYYYFFLNIKEMRKDQRDHPLIYSGTTTKTKISSVHLRRLETCVNIRLQSEGRDTVHEQGLKEVSAIPEVFGTLTDLSGVEITGLLPTGKFSK